MQATGRRRLFLSMCTAGLACAQPAAAQPTAAPVTVGGWTIRDLRGICSAQTSQSGGLFAEIQLEADSNDTMLRIRNPSWSALRERHGDRTILRFSNGRHYDAGINPRGRAAADDERVTTVDVSYSGELLEDFARAHRVDIWIGGMPAGTLSLRGTSAVAERLRSCTAATARRHPPPALAPPPFHAAPPPAGATPPVYRSGSISDVDYPASALRAEEQGTVTMRLSINEDGRVTDCTITASSGSSILDSTSCSLAVRRFRFTPARDANGNNVPGMVTRSIRWSLPSLSPEAQPPAPIPPK